MRLLIVEDEPRLLKNLALALREAGYAVDTAEDGADGLHKALTYDYDAIVLDVMMPRLDGWQVLERLRRAKQTPVLLLTARDTSHDRVHCELASAPTVGDAARLRQVITNLLANAVAYNREGGEIRLATRTEDSAALLSVADTGPGIAPEDLPHVFERFYRADKERARRGTRRARARHLPDHL
jgi:signal transduction histidine kinase